MSDEEDGEILICDDGALRLVCAMVESAVDEYKALCHAGAIVDGRLEPTFVRGNGELLREVVDYKFAPQVRELLHFFDGSPLDEWFDHANLNHINADAVRRKLHEFDEDMQHLRSVADKPHVCEDCGAELQPKCISYRLVCAECGSVNIVNIECEEGALCQS